MTAVNPKLDLVLERIVDVAPDLVWAAWTVPEHVKKWFTPAPWKTVECEIDLRPGGVFRFVMRSPEGQDYPYSCCILEVTPKRQLIWTRALGPGYRPNAGDDMPLFTAVVTIEPHGSGTRYTATALHADETARQKHADMGFHDGWGKALDQLVAMARTM